MGRTYRRGRHRFRPIFRARMMWERARRGYSTEDCWSLDYYLATVTVGGIQNLREWKTGYPAELGSWDAWDAILARIQAGFQAFIDEDGWFENPEIEAVYKDGLALYGQWFGALWD